MNSGEEIITLQFGGFANFIGAHYFNIQEAGFSYNPDFIPDILPDRLFRASKDISSGNIVNYNPRTVLVDDEIVSRIVEADEKQKNCVEGETCLDALSEECSPGVSHNQAEKTSIDCLLKEHESLENVKSWTDYLKVPLHRRSYTYTPKEYGLNCPESSYYKGYSFSKQLSFCEKFEDNIRFFAEECDTLQGFQIISEGHSAYSGIASAALDHLKDEYVKKVRILKPAYFLPESTSYYEKQLYICNAVTFLAEANDNVDLIIPISMLDDPWKLKQEPTNLSLRNINYKDFDMFGSSAVLAATLEYITLPYRKRDKRNISMSEYCQINVVGRSISNAGILMPFPKINDEFLPNILKNWNESSFFESVSPFCPFDSNTTADIMYTFNKGLTKKKSFDRTKNILVEENNQELVDNLNAFIYTYYSAKMMKDFSSTSNFRIPTTFPSIFNNNYNLFSSSMTELVGRIGEFNGIGCLINSKETKNYLDSLCSRALMSFRKIRLASEEASEIDFNFVIDRLVTLASNYSDEYQL